MGWGCCWPAATPRASISSSVCPQAPSWNTMAWHLARDPNQPAPTSKRRSIPSRPVGNARRILIEPPGSLTLTDVCIGSDLESLILHGLAALQETLPQDVAGLTADTLAIAHVSKTTGVFSVLEDASIVADYVRQLGVFAPRKTTRATNDATTSVSSSSITPSMGAMEVEETL